MKRLLIVNDFAMIGGAELSLLSLTAALDRQQFETEVLLFEDGTLRSSLIAQQVEVRQILFPLAFLRTPLVADGLDVAKRIPLLFHVGCQTKAVARLIALGKYDIVITNSLKSLLVTRAALRLVHGNVKHVHCLHSILPEQKTIVTRVLAYLMSRSDIVICNSQATLERAQLHNATGRKSAIIRQGFYRPTPLQSAPERGHWIIGSAGRFDPIKNYEFIIDAAQLLKDRHPNLRVHIAGQAYTANDRDYKSKLADYIRNCKMNDIVVIKDFTDNIWSFMDSLQVFMLSSHTESFSRVLAEAMWSGKPTIATRVGAIPELVQDDITGFTVMPGDVQAAARVLESLMTKPDLALRLGMSGRLYAEEHLSLRSSMNAWHKLLLAL